MSTFAVKIERIVKVENHPNADRLDLIQILDWNCVTAKGNFREGDLCIYIPIDSVLPQDIEDTIFGLEAKVRPSNHRIRTIKLRGAISQGMAVKPEVFGLHGFKEGTDVTQKLRITKYEPPAHLSPQSAAAPTAKRHVNPNFKKYTGLENAKNYPGVFQPGEIVSVTEKVHGTNFRAGYVPFHADTLLKKVKRLLGLAPKYEFVYGSHNVQLQSKLLYKGYYDKNVYAEAVHKYDLKNLLKPGEVVYGEVYGSSIQKGYTYGCKDGERKLVLFDLMLDGEYVSTDGFLDWAYQRSLPVVPEIYRGPFDLAAIKAMTLGNSVMAPDQKVREGVVVKPLKEEKCFIGRKMLKFISDAYLLGDQSDFH